jgi:hypothetical protein
MVAASGQQHVFVGGGVEQTWCGPGCSDDVCLLSANSLSRCRTNSLYPEQPGDEANDGCIGRPLAAE